MVNKNLYVMLLILKFIKLVEVNTSWPEHPVNKKNYHNCSFIKKIIFNLFLILTYYIYLN